MHVYISLSLYIYMYIYKYGKNDGHVRGTLLDLSYISLHREGHFFTIWTAFRFAFPALRKTTSGGIAGSVQNM